MRSETRAWGLTLLVLLVSGIASAAHACPEDEALESVAVGVLLGEIERSPAALKEALARLGSSAVEAYLLSAATDAELGARLDDLAGRLALPLRCGRAEREGAIVVVAAPDVATLAASGELVRGSLRPGYPDAHLIFRDADGRTRRVPVDRERLAEGVRLPELAAGERREVHLVADTPEGPRPVARVPGPLPPREPLGGSIDPAAIVGALRDSVRAPALRPNALLEREATEHARLVCEVRHASHEGMRGDPEARLLARGIAARVVGEAVARAESLGEAMAALLASPSHRAALEDSRFTDLGIGVARRGTTRCVVALLAAFPRAVPPARPPTEVDTPRPRRH